MNLAFSILNRTSDEFRNILEIPEPKWKRHIVLSSDSGYSTAESLDKCGWNVSEVKSGLMWRLSVCLKVYFVLLAICTCLCYVSRDVVWVTLHTDFC